MNKRLLLSAVALTGAAVLLQAQTAPPASPAPASPASALPLPSATPIPNELRVPSPDAPPLTERDILEQLRAAENGGSITRMPQGQNVQRRPPKPAPGAAPDQGNGTTEITARVGAFDQKGHVAVFTKDVYVENPQFVVNCDKLTAYLKQKDKEDKDAPKVQPTAAGHPVPPAPGKPNLPPSPLPAARATPPPPGAKVRVSSATSGNATQAERDAAVKEENAATAAQKQKSSGGLQQAVCEGNVVITQDKIDPDGTVTRNVGYGKKALYFADTGDIYLFGNPKVEQGINVCVSLDESTVIILNRDGHMTVNGPHRTVIKEDNATASSSQ